MSASTHEAVLGGARWRLTLHPDGRWDVARRMGHIWDEAASGDRGLAGLRDSAADLRKFGEWFAEAGADVLVTLAEIAERGGANTGCMACGHRHADPEGLGCAWCRCGHPKDCGCAGCAALADVAERSTTP